MGKRRKEQKKGIRGRRKKEHGKKKRRVDEGGVGKTREKNSKR